MSKTRDFDDLILSDLFGENDPDDEARLREALREDPDLKTQHDELKGVMRAVEQAELSHEPGEEFWDGVWSNFQNRLLAEEQQKRIFNLEWFYSLFDFRSPMVQFVTVVVLLVVGIFIGKALTVGEHKQNGYERADTISFPYEQDVDENTNQYLVKAAESSLNRSESLIDEFLQLNPASAREGESIIMPARENSIQLLDEIASLRGTFRDPRFTEITGLFDEIELMLGEIAAIQGNPENVAFEITALQEGIRNSGLIDRLRGTSIQIFVNGQEVKLEGSLVKNR